MIKTITIDNKTIGFKATAATPIRYKAMFGADLFADMAKMQNVDPTTMEGFDITVLCQIIWICAKAFNKDLPPLDDWFDTFDSFPLIQVFSEVMELITNSMVTEKK